MKRSFKIIMGVLMLSAITFSCKKEQEVDKDTSTFEEDNFANSTSTDLGSISDEAGRNKTVSGFRTSQSTEILTGSCATLQFDTLVNSNPDSITVNFGNTNCLCNDGKYRRGSILITFTGKYKDSLATVTIKPMNYFVDDNGVSGTKTVKNLGHNAQGHLVYTYSENISITKPGGGTVNRQASMQREWLTGENTVVYYDDKYSITGSASGQSSGGRSFTTEITKALIRDMSFACRKHFVSGTVVHTPSKKPARTVDFGDGTCDDIVTVTVNGKTYTIHLDK